MSDARPRVAIVGGLRTPFAKQSSAYKELSALDLGRFVVRELVERSGVDPARIAVVGYCFGGTGALELARSGADIAGAVSFHGGLSNPDPASSVKSSPSE